MQLNSNFYTTFEFEWFLRLKAFYASTPNTFEIMNIPLKSHCLASCIHISSFLCISSSQLLWSISSYIRFCIFASIQHSQYFTISTSNSILTGLKSAINYKRVLRVAKAIATQHCSLTNTFKQKYVLQLLIKEFNVLALFAI